MNSSDTHPKVFSFSGGILKVSELVWQSILICVYIYDYYICICIYICMYDQSLANNCCFDKSLFSVMFAVHLVKAGAAPWVTFQLPTCQDQHGLLLRGRQSGGPSIGAQLEITGAGISIIWKGLLVFAVWQTYEYIWFSNSLAALSLFYRYFEEWRCSTNTSRGCCRHLGERLPFQCGNHPSRPWISICL